MNILKELKVIFEAENNESASELIADCFYEHNVGGVVLESPDEKTEEWGEDAILSEVYSVAGYIYENETLELIKTKVSARAEDLNIKIRFEIKEIREEDWAHSWKDFFYPVEISENIVIRPSWRKLDKKYKIVIDIDPGMAFGSGSHPTTTLCIKLLEQIVEKEDTVLDIGCGSGILMVGAAKLGAGKLKGIDNDSAAVDISRENMKLNGIKEKKYEVLKSNLVDNTDERFNVIVANILAEVIVELIPNLDKVSHEKTKFIFSGIILEKKDMVLEKMRKFNINPDKIYEESGWVAISGIYNNQDIKN